MEIKSEEDLQELIDNKIEESTTLEYKSLDSLTNNAEIAKDVSAMANSEGGIIIYGIKEDAEKYPEEIEWSSDKGLKDKIDQVLSSRINRKIEGCNIEEVQSDEDNKKFVIVVNVPRSDIAPHQSIRSGGSKKYYRRSNSRIREMEHGEIEDLFFARKRPKLRIELRSNLLVHQPVLDLVILNEGKVLAEKVYSAIKVPEQFRINGEGWIETSNDFGIRKYEYYNTSSLPFYPKVESSIAKISLHKEKRVLEKFQFIFMIVCENMEIIEGVIRGDFLKKLDSGKFIETVVLKEGEPRGHVFAELC